MERKFENIDYLEKGNSKQRHCWALLTENGILGKLANYGPLLAGTIPIGIDTDSSDLDIVCTVANRDTFVTESVRLFGGCENFRIWRSGHDGAVVCRFTLGGMDIEIYGGEEQPENSAAFRHMLVEHRLLCLGGERFRREVVRLKESGIKTEPAFVALLGIGGDPYEEMLKAGGMTDEELGVFLKNAGF